MLSTMSAVEENFITLGLGNTFMAGDLCLPNSGDVVETFSEHDLV